jgi:hypothetical protein
MGGWRSSIRTTFPPLEFSIIKPFCAIPIYKDASFLHQKYVVDRFSTEEIAKQISSSRPTILKWLKKHEIAVRPAGSNVRRRNLAYGLRLKRRKEIPHKREQKIIEKMKKLRAKGLSYWKIAAAFNDLKIPTKSRNTKWRARTIQKIILKNSLKV